MKFRQLLSNIDASNSYEVLEETGDLKTNQSTRCCIIENCYNCDCEFCKPGRICIAECEF